MENKHPKQKNWTLFLALPLLALGITFLLKYCKTSEMMNFLLERGMDIRTMQKQPGYQDARATQIYTHVLNRGGNAVVSSSGIVLSG